MEASRGGGVEVAIKEDKQGLEDTRRGKKRFEAQQMVMVLSQLGPQPDCLGAQLAQSRCAEVGSVRGAAAGARCLIHDWVLGDGYARSDRAHSDEPGRASGSRIGGRLD